MIVKDEVGGRGGSKAGIALREQQEGSSCYNVLCGNILHLDRIHVNTLVVTLSCNFARCYHWGETGWKVHEQDLDCFLQLNVNLQLSPNKSLKYQHYTYFTLTSEWALYFKCLGHSNVLVSCLHSRLNESLTQQRNLLNY